MRLLVTGSAGHLGEGLVRTLRDSGHEVVGLDVRDSPYTTEVGSITDRPLVRRCMAGVRAVFHAATLHKPHVATHLRREFVDVNVTGTLNTSPFLPEDLPELRVDAPRAVRRRVPGYEAEYARRGWRMFPSIGRVYVNRRAREELGWRPRYDFQSILDRLAAGDDPRSPLARAIGSKGTMPRPLGMAHTPSYRCSLSTMIVPAIQIRTRWSAATRVHQDTRYDLDRHG